MLNKETMLESCSYQTKQARAIIESIDIDKREAFINGYCVSSKDIAKMFANGLDREDLYKMIDLLKVTVDAVENIAQSVKDNAIFKV